MTKGPVYNAGSRAVQARAGVVARAERSANAIGGLIPPVAADFLAEQAAVILGWVDPSGRVWCSALHGEPGFLRPLNQDTIEIAATPAAADPIAQVAHGDHIGTLVIDPATRRRMRLNGVVAASGDGRLVVAVEEVIANCPKYITQRQRRDTVATRQAAPPTAASDRLNDRQARRIRGADTFFLATAEADHGAVDASHRGGNPGFVHVRDDRHLVWPDYAGNAMFLSLGNLETNPQAGLLFLDWDDGTMLQLTGTATVDWEPSAAANHPGAERLIGFDLDAVREHSGDHPSHWELRALSRFNP